MLKDFKKPKQTRYYLVLYSFLMGVACIAGHFFMTIMDGHLLEHWSIGHFLHHLLHAFVLVALTGFFLVLYSRQREKEKKRYEAQISNLHTNLTVAENQLIRAAKLASVGELAAGVAHEVMNPLSSISSYCQLIQRNHNKLDAAQMTQYAHNISGEIFRVSRILKEVKDYAKPSAADEEKKLINPDQVVLETLEMLFIDSRFKNIQIVKDLNEQPFLCAISREKMKQVLLNIFINAADAMPEGGIVKVTSRLLSNGKKYSHYSLSIQDTGLGIDKKNYKYIFEPFFTTKGNGNGTGLGLSVSRRIMQNFGGEIHFETEKNKGTTFTIELPTSGPVSGQELSLSS